MNFVPRSLPGYLLPLYEESHSLLGHYSGYFIVAGTVIFAVLAAFAFSTYRRRTGLRTELRRKEEEAKLSTNLCAAIAELTGLLDKDEIAIRALRRANSQMGTSSMIIGELKPGSDYDLTAYSLANAQLISETLRLKSDGLVQVTRTLSESGAIWNTTVQEIARRISGPAKKDKAVMQFLNKYLSGERISFVAPFAGNASSFIAFDHTDGLHRNVLRGSMSTYVQYLYSAIQAAELYSLTKEKKAELEDLLDNSIPALVTLSPEGTVQTANHVACDLLSDNHLIGKKIQDYLSPADVQRLNELLGGLAALTAEKVVRFEAKLTGRATGIVEVEFAIKFDPVARIFRVSIQDIGDRRAQDEFVDHEKKIESLEKLASSLSHDLNNIVGSIMGYASLLKRRLPPDSKEYRYADIIEDSSKRTTDLVKQVLGFSQLDTRTVEVVDLNQFVNDVAIEFGNTHVDKYTVMLTHSTQSVRARISTSQMKRVLLAILENAAESMENGGTIECLTGIMEKFDMPLAPARKEQQCLIEIKDHGTGMDESIRRRIFEPFFTTKREKKYTGLSMSAAFNIVRHHKGFITVDSAPGAGTKVRLFLPYFCEKESPKNDTTTAKSVDPKGTKIMVVDDDESVRQLGVDILSEQGYSIVTANDGLQALERFRENPDTRLVVLDMVMPVMGGKEACMEIKKMPNPPKVLICTGFSELSDLETILGTYAEGLLQKPYTTSDLTTAVETILKSLPSGEA